MPSIQATEFASRTEKFRASLAAQALDGAVLVHPIDMLYFCGTRQNGALWVPTQGTPVLLVRKSLARAQQESVVEPRPFPPSKELSTTIGPARRIGFAYAHTPAQVLEWYGRILPGRTFGDVSFAIREQRSVKSPAEVELLRTVARKVCGVFAEVPTFLHAGMRELDLAAEVEYRLRKAGNEGSPPMGAFNQSTFVGLVAAGASAAEPGYFDGPVGGHGLSAAAPHGPSIRSIEAGAPVLLDFTSVVEGYVTDMTRVFVCGDLAPELLRAFDIAVAIQKEVADRLRPGAVPADIYDRACRLAQEAGLGERFMGPPGEQARFVGHGIGLELDELPVLARGFEAPLVAGQVIAVEPKFVFPGMGAVGIENVWLVTESGGERLTVLPDDLVRV